MNDILNTVDKANHLHSLNEKAAKTKHPYNACIAGMYANTYGILHKNNSMKGDLMQWWSCGWRASDNAKEMSQRISAMQDKKDKIRLKDWLRRKKNKK